MRICLYAGSGAGKSTVAAKVYAELKARGHNIELVQEYIKTWAYQQRPVKGYDQVYICANQLHAEDFLFQHGVEYVITDSPLFLQCFYAWKYRLSVWESVVEIVRDFSNSHPSLDIFLDRDGVPFQQNGRYEDEADAKENDVKLLEFLAWMGVKPTVVKTMESEKIVALFEEAIK